MDMKRILITSALLSTFLLSSCSKYGYVVKREEVVHAIWDGSSRAERIIEGADSKSFEVINPTHSSRDKYAKDKNSVYYFQEVIEGAIPSTFRLLTEWYAVDSESVFFIGSLLPGKDEKTFEVLNGFWTRDKNGIYFFHKAVDVCDPDSFEVVLEIWAVDSECTYSGETTIYDLDTETFKAFDSYYAKDSRYVYSRFNKGTVLYGSASYVRIIDKVLDADAESFITIDARACEFDAKDKYRCYSRGETAPCVCGQ